MYQSKQSLIIDFNKNDEIFVISVKAIEVIINYLYI